MHNSWRMVFFGSVGPVFGSDPFGSTVRPVGRFTVPLSATITFFHGDWPCPDGKSGSSAITARINARAKSTSMNLTGALSELYRQLAVGVVGDLGSKVPKLNFDCNGLPASTVFTRVG